MRPHAYLDTSVLVAAHMRERHTAQAQAWLSAQGDRLLVVSAWALVECESALAIKFRRGEIDAPQQAAAMADIDAFVGRLANVAVPCEADYRRARELCRPPAAGLRAGDALHLALALRLNVRQFATLDTTLAANAAAHGLEAALPGFGTGNAINSGNPR